MPNMDCFAWAGNGCYALTECICRHEDTCPFYKTKLQIEVDYLNAVRRKKKLGLNVDIVNVNTILI